MKICARCGKEFDPPDSNTDVCGDCADDLRQEELAEQDRLTAEAIADQMNREAYEEEKAEEHFRSVEITGWQ